LYSENYNYLIPKKPENSETHENFRLFSSFFRAFSELIQHINDSVQKISIIVFRKLQIIIIPKKPENSETHENFRTFSSFRVFSELTHRYFRY
jgi:hypothetical protein